MPFSDQLRRFIRRAAAILIVVSLLMSLFTFMAVAAEASEEDNYDLPWLWPVPGSYRINSLDYYSDGGIHNQGQCIDISANGHTGSTRLDIISATSGTVFYIQDIYKEGSNKGSGWGNYVIVRSGNINILYAHLKEVTCDYGPIEAGEVIGKMGNTGNSTGVHLHMQAYPANSNSSSTAIRVFDQYMDNPLYATRFQFWRGLETRSVRYGARIREYYKTLSGSYYGYSGGLDLSYPTDPASALVTVIRSSGAKVYSAPSAESQYEVDILATGASVAVSASYRDAYGVSWLRLSDADGERWISSLDVGFKEYFYQTVLKDEISPSGALGTSADIVFSGRVESVNDIISLRAVLLKDSQSFRSAEISVGTDAYSYVADSFSALKLQELSDGDYTLELYVTESASYPGADSRTKEYRLTSSAFVIDSSLADKIPPLLEPVHIESLSSSVVELSCAAYDNSAVRSVTALFQLGDFSYEAPFVFTDGRYRLSVPTSALKGSGEYQITVTALDSYANADTRTLTLTVPPSATGEIFRVTDAASPNLRVRSGPGLSYSRVSNVYPGDTFTVTEKVEADGYVWGKYSVGWVALTKLSDSTVLCEYVGGAVYYLQYHLNGGEGELPASMELRLDETFTVPTVVPTRDGCTFLGWSESSAATTATYTAGSTYTPKSSMTLFAVWRDEEAPVISDITVSEDSWTKEPLTVTVVATENTNEVYYSFDGGVLWQRSPSILVSENTVFDVGTILVRDAHDNVTSYPVVFEIKTIDTEAPDVSSASVNITTDASGATVTIDQVVDALSGIDTYQLVLTPIGGTDSLTFTIKPGDTIPLADGVYAGLLSVKDKVGNEATIALQRFLIGDPQPLSTPTPVTITATAATFVKLSWPKNDVADSYRIEVSLDETFTNPLIAVSEANAYVFHDLEPGNSYFLRVTAICADGVFLSSAPSESLSFITLNNDTTVYSIPAMSDAVISDTDDSITWVLPYAQTKVDLTAEISANAVIHYFEDSSLTSAIPASQVISYAMTGTETTVYLHVTAENGDNRTYALTMTRAAASAASPIVTHTPQDQTLLIGEKGSSLTLSATSNDGGAVSVEWFASHNGATPLQIGSGLTCDLLFDASGEYRVYAVVTNTNDKCQTMSVSVTSAASVITVKKHASALSVQCPSYDYTGLAPSAISCVGYTGDGSVTYRFYRDALGQVEIAPPVSAGIYYVKAFASETDRYEAAESTIVSFEIRKLKNDKLPSLHVVQPTLRDRIGYITVYDDLVEYSLNGGDWMPISTSTLTFVEGDEVLFRYIESENVAAGAVYTVKIRTFDGTTAIEPNGSVDMTVRDNYLVIAEHSLTPEDLLLALTMRDDVYLYDANHQRVSGDDVLIATGYRIAIEDEYGEFLSYTVIILGDLDRDGKVTEEDAYQILYLSNGMAISDSTFDVIAGDINGDGVLTSLDARLALVMI